MTLVVALPMCAQLPQEFGRFKKAAKIPTPTVPETELINKIAKDGAFILSQSYQLEDSVGKFFGLSGNKEFGSESSIAFKVRDGYLLYDVARVPWDYNPRYAKLKKRYNPVLFPSQFSEIGGEARYDSIYYDNKTISTIYPNQIYGMKADTFFNDGFSVGHSIGETEGYLIWFQIPEDVDLNSSANIGVTSIKHNLEVSEDRSKEYTIPMPTLNGTILGGIYLVPKITSVGRVDFTMEGIIINENDEWKLICPFTDTENIFTASPVAVEAEEDVEVELTPNDGKK